MTQRNPPQTVREAALLVQATPENMSGNPITYNLERPSVSEKAQCAALPV